MEAHGARLSRMARGLLGDPSEAADAVQETFLAAWRGARDGGDPGAWLATVCLNACRMRLRRRGRERRALEAVARSRPVAAPPPSHAEAEEARAAFRAALTGLPEREREAFVLIAVEGLGAASAGAVMGCSADAARSHLSRARKALGERLRDLLT